MKETNSARSPADWLIYFLFASSNFDKSSNAAPVSGRFFKLVMTRASEMRDWRLPFGARMARSLNADRSMTKRVMTRLAECAEHQIDVIPRDNVLSSYAMHRL